MELKTIPKELDNEIDASLASHVLRRISVPESFRFFTEVEHYTRKFTPSLTSFLNEIDNVPLESIEFHFERGDFQKWIKSIVGDEELALRLSGIKKSLRGDELKKAIQEVTKERVDQLKHEMWLSQRRATRLEKTNFFGQRVIFGIDLSKIEGEGEVMCPKCKEILSPDDPIGMTYEVFGSADSEDGTLAEAFIKCNKCDSIIRLHGFEMLKEAEQPDPLQ